MYCNAVARFCMLFVPQMETHTPLQRAMDSVSPEIDTALACYKADGQVVKAWDAITESLGKHPQLVWSQTCLPRFVACHVGNRGGLGIVLSEALSNGAKHCSAGWSYKKANANDGAWPQQLRHGPP